MSKLTGHQLQAAIIAGANALNNSKALIDAMNVFPVPDGDTGTNMYLTALSAAIEAGKAPKGSGIDAVAKEASSGALRGARGNSGVILSQLFRGLAKGFEGMSEATPQNIAQALAQAVETAYKAIMKPKEGTILTVSRGVAEKAAELTEKEIRVDELFYHIIQHGYGVLKKTKDMLPALKAADVEDAGGKGFLVILEGMYAAITGQASESLAPLQGAGESGGEGAFRESANKFPHFKTEADIEFGYCTELFIMADAPAENVENEITKGIMEYLDGVGDSVVVVSDGNLIKIHVHTNNPGAVLEKAIAYGQIDNVKIENMRAQNAGLTAKTAKPEEPAPAAPVSGFKDTGFVAVANGKGFMDIFTSLGADYVIEGGQSMNPSAEDFLKAIYTVPANAVILFPNNKNILLAARQAATMCPEKEVYVVPSRSMPQGLAALTGYNYSRNAAENAALMEDVIKNVHTGLLTRAVRATVIDDMNIAKNDAICIIDGKINLVHKNVTEASRRMADAMITEDTAFVTVYAGESAKPKDAEKLLAYIRKEHPDVECELQNGGQPVYQYIISAE